MPGESTSPWFYYISPSPNLFFDLIIDPKRKGVAALSVFIICKEN